MSVVATRPLGKLEQLAYERQARDLERWPARSIEDCEPDGYWWDEEAAERVITFIEGYCRHHKGEWAGQPFRLEPWQREIVRTVFGWRRPDGTRRFRTAYVEVPRKNGKTELAAAVALYLLVADGEEGAEVYSAATTRDQAKIVHDAAVRMVRRSPDLRRFVRDYRNNLSVEALGAKFAPLSSDSNTLDGLNPHAAILDELHAHKDRHVRDVLLTGMGARRQPLEWIITTAGVYDPTSIGWEQYEYARSVLEGVFDDPNYYAFIAAADPDDDWTDPETWAKANPNLGVSVKLEYLEELAERAKRSPSFLNTFLRYHLNVWTQQIERWIAPEIWKKGAAPVNEGALEGERCFAALDLASTTDLTALALAFENELGGFDLLMRYWVPEDRIMERAQKDRVPYDAWVRDGWIQATPGDVVDYEWIRQEIHDLADRFEIVELAYDPWNATQLAVQLLRDGLPMVEMRQGYKTMSPAAKEFERLVVAGRIRHGGHPVLAWNVNNIAIAQDPAGNIKPDKQRSREKIDGAVAAIMAIGRASVQLEGEDANPYASGGFFVLG